MKLSILICSLPERCKELSFLLTELFSQCKKTKEVEVLIDIDNQVKTIGAKRNHLLNMATGDYIVFIDDDDMISSNYISLVLDALKTNPDCAGINGVMFNAGIKDRPFTHSIKHGSWYTGEDAYYRTPNHWNPIKRSIALQVMFKEINWGEDHDYSNRIFPLLKSEVYINEPIYYYRFDTNKSVAVRRMNEKVTV